MTLTVKVALNPNSTNQFSRSHEGSAVSLNVDKEHTNAPIQEPVFFIAHFLDPYHTAAF